MTTPRTLARLRPTDIIADVEAVDVPDTYYTRGNNVVFRRNRVQRSGGYLPVFDGAIEKPLHLTPILTETAPYWLYPTDQDSIYVTDGTGHFDITPTPAPAPTIPDPFTSTILNGVPVINDATNAPVYWDGNTGNAMLPLPGWQAGHRCNVIRAYKNYLIAMAYDDGVTFNPELLVWSDAAAPGQVPQEWLPTATNDAGFLAVSDEPGEILDAQVLRDQLVIYKRSSVYTLDFVGGNNIFALRSLYRDTGCLSRNCVAAVRGFHVVLTEDDVILNDGQQIRSLLDRRWRRTLFSRLNPDQALRSFVTHYEAAREVWVCIPRNGTTYPNAALVWNYEEDRIGWREFPEAPDIKQGRSAVTLATGTTWDTLTGTWDELQGTWDSLGQVPDEDRLILAQLTDDEFLAADLATDTAGTAIVANLARESYDFGEPERVKTIKKVFPRIITAGGTFEVRVGTQMRPQAPITWQPWLPFDGETPIHTFATGRFISFEVRSTGGGIWRTNGFDVAFEFRGRQ